MTTSAYRILKLESMIKNSIIANHTFFTFITFSRINSSSYINPIVIQHLQDLFFKMNVIKIICHSLPSKYCWSSRRLVSTYPQRNNFSSSKTSWRASWKTKNCYAEDIFKTSWWHIFKTSSRRLEDKQNCLLEISVCTKSKCVSSKSIFPKSISDESKANPKCINENLIISIFVFFWNTSNRSILRIKISEIGDWPSEAIKAKFQVTYYTYIFKWKIVYTRLYIYN